MTPPPESTGSLALEIERLRSTVNTGFARIEGALALLVQRSDQTDRTLAEQREEQDRQDTRISRLERWMWLAIGVSTALGTVGGWLAGSLLR
jgi:hypothetical protein